MTMALDRLELGTPLNVAVIDYNGLGAFSHYGLTVRDYPGLIPTVDTAVAFAGETLVLRPWQRELSFHAELVAIIGRDVKPGEGESAENALLGYSLGLGIWDNAPIDDLKNGVTRDTGVNTTYGYLIDSSRQQGRTILSVGELPPRDELKLTLHVPGHPPANFHQKDLLFDGPRMLRECSKLVGFCRGDVICLGPSDAPVVVGAQERLPTGGVIEAEGPPFPTIQIPIDDRRDPYSALPWPSCELNFVARYPHLRSTTGIE
jgi:2-keto-4-pentenoate hydratase/2-oxohepta-3-ene-1,7-dioic acid hydratase in catechol pathway